MFSTQHHNIPHSGLPGVMMQCCCTYKIQDLLGFVWPASVYRAK